MSFNKSKTSFVWFDVEQGGVDYNKHPLIQAAFIATGPMPDFDIIEQLEVKIKFNESDCDPKALEMNSYDKQVWEKEAMSPREALFTMQDFFDRHSSLSRISKKGNEYFIVKPVGHNITRFDIPSIHAFFKKFDAFCPIAFNGLDTLQFFISMFWLMGKDTRSYSMDSLCKLFDIDAGGHDALQDVKANIDLMKKFLKSGFPIMF